VSGVAGAPADEATILLGAQQQEPSARSSRRGQLRRALPFIALAGLALLVVLGPLLAPFDPVKQQVGEPLTGPSPSHLFGTDQFGRDVFSRVLAGARTSIGVGAIATLAALVAGAILGATAASLGRWVDEVIMRTLDIVLSFPGILLAVVMAAVLGAGWTTTVLVMAVVYTPAFARIVRAVVLGELSEDYVTAARLIGSTRVRVMTYHVGVNAILPILVFATVVLADAIVLEAALSFIGVGIRPPEPSWGNVMSEGRAFISSGRWWITTAGGTAVFVTVLLLNWLSDDLRRRLER
jgi:ABC-type dipeptide/oligopeptide/nickel transport system permease subunit